MSSEPPTEETAEMLLPPKDQQQERIAIGDGDLDQSQKPPAELWEWLPGDESLYWLRPEKRRN